MCADQILKHCFERDNHIKSFDGHSRKNIFLLISFLILLFVPVFVLGQKTFVTIGPELALPAHYNQSNNNRGKGFGGSVRIESFWSKHVSGMATAGFLSLLKRVLMHSSQLILIR